MIFCTNKIFRPQDLSAVPSQIWQLFNVQGSLHHKYIPIYVQQDATLHSLFIYGNCSTCFSWHLHPSSGAHTTVSTASGTWQTVTAPCRYRGRVGTAEQFQLFHDDGWRYNPKHVEQFPEINQMFNVESCWLYIIIYLRYTELWILNLGQLYY